MAIGVRETISFKPSSLLFGEGGNELGSKSAEVLLIPILVAHHRSIMFAQRIVGAPLDIFVMDAAG